MDWLGIARKLIWFFSPCRFPEEAEEGSTVSAGGQNTHGRQREGVLFLVGLGYHQRALAIN